MTLDQNLTLFENSKHILAELKNQYRSPADGDLPAANC